MEEKMKITKIEIIPVNIPFTRTLKTAIGDWSLAEFVIVRMHTDAGIVGLGEVPPWMAVSRTSQGAIIQILKDYICPVILGLDPFQVEKAWDLMDLHAPGNPMAGTPIDMAMYDIMGKALKTPVYNLLGGKFRDKVPTAAIIGFGDTKAMVKECKEWLALGVKAVRIKVGLGMATDMKNTEAIRKTIGPDVTLRVDCNQAFTRNEAIRVLQALEKFDLELAEQPVAWHDLAGMGMVARNVRTPIMSHETLLDRFDALHLIEYGAAGVFGLKLDRPGGFVNVKRVNALAELNNIPCFMCSSIELGVSTSAAAHLAVSLKNMKLASEFSGPQTITDDIVKNPIPIKDGYAKPWDAPGLGVELDEKKLQKYAGKSIVCE
jgi:L-alanine-DL-glutamate epimerase-like enolase superfamily enzyme